MKNIFKNFAIFAIAMMAIVPALTLATPASAAAPADSLMWGNTMTNVDDASGLGNVDPRILAGKVINILLGFLGIIAVLIILLGGFKWMTAGGNDDGITEAKAMISAGIIGMVIILSAFGIAQYVVGILYTATEAG